MDISIDNGCTHDMKLESKYFYEVLTGTKKVEFRMLDKKRKLIKVGDYIKFKNINTEELCTVKVSSLETYSCFYVALFLCGYNLELLSCDGSSLLRDLMRIYSDKLGKSEVLAIHFK